jgi:hypothetical protein
MAIALRLATLLGARLLHRIMRRFSNCAFEVPIGDLHVVLEWIARAQVKFRGECQVDNMA